MSFCPQVRQLVTKLERRNQNNRKTVGAASGRDAGASGGRVPVAAGGALPQRRHGAACTAFSGNDLRAEPTK